MTGDEAVEALAEMLAWKQQEQARLAAPRPCPVATVEEYGDLWRLRNELARDLAGEHDLTVRLDLQASVAACDADIAAAKADPALAAQIRAWWVRRYE
jgi:hypothetical protein